MTRPTLRDLQGMPLLARPVRWVRRRRIIRRYLRAVATELMGTTAGIEEVERRAAARVDVLYQSTAATVADRSDVLVEGVSRKVDGVTATHARELQRLDDHVAELRARLDRLERLLDVTDAAAAPPPPSAPPPSGEPSRPS